MRPAQQITPETEEERFVHRFDLKEIDAENKSLFRRLSYLWRLRATTRLLEKRLSPGSDILDLGCASGNLAITMAEAGFQVTGVDMRSGFISYAQKKDDGNLVTWRTGDAFKIGFEADFSAVVMSEIIEHVTDPAALIRNALSLVAPNGILLLSTPNGANSLNGLPSFNEARRNTNSFQDVVIGPAGEDHIFAFRAEEMYSLVEKAGGFIASVSYVGSILLNTHVQWILNTPVFGRVYLAAARLANRLPWLATRLSHTMLFVITPARNEC